MESVSLSQLPAGYDGHPQVLEIIPFSKGHS